MYSEAGIPKSVEIMFPGNRGIGTAIEAEVNIIKKTKKMAVAFMFLLLLFLLFDAVFVS